jgi:hypothetical protein
MKKILLPSLGLIASLILSQHTLALTFKTGEVIGPDGKSYVGMSPQNKARILANTESGEIKSGVMNKQFYLVNNNQLVIVPVTELRNKTTAERMAIIKQAIRIEGDLQLSNTGQSPTLSTHIDSGMDSDMDNATQEVELSLDSEIQEANDHLENELGNDLERDLDSVFDDKFENEVSDHLENDLEHDLNEALGHDFENEINDHLENDHTFDRVDNDDQNESHDDNDSDDSHDSNDDRGDHDDHDDHDND